MPQETSAVLPDGQQNGARDEIFKLVFQFREALIRHIEKNYGNCGDAEALADAVILQVAMKYEYFRRDSNWLAVAKKVAYYAALQAYRSRKRRLDAHLAAAKPEAVDDSPATKLIAEEETARLVRALKALRKSERKLLKYWMSGRTLKQIGRRCKISGSNSTIRQRVLKAKAQLQKLLAEDLDHD